MAHTVPTGRSRGGGRLCRGHSPRCRDHIPQERGYAALLSVDITQLPLTTPYMVIIMSCILIGLGRTFSTLVMMRSPRPGSG